MLVQMSTHSEAIPRESGSMQLPTAVAGTWVRDCLHRHELKQTWSTDLLSACRRLVACFRRCPQYLALRFHFRTLLQQLLSEPLRDGTVILVTCGRMGSGSTVGQQPRQHGNPTNYTSTGGPRLSDLSASVKAILPAAQVAAPQIYTASPGLQLRQLRGLTIWDIDAHCVSLCRASLPLLSSYLGTTVQNL